MVVSNPTHDVNIARPWHAPLTEAEGEEVLRICEEFGLRLYGRQITPVSSAGELMGSRSIGRSSIAALTEDRLSRSSAFVADPGALPSCHEPNAHGA